MAKRIIFGTILMALMLAMTVLLFLHLMVF